MIALAYQSTLLQGTTKVGKIPCGADGYYDVVAGGFDTYNSAGAYYTWESAKPIFDKSSHFMRRVQNKALYGEYGHPDFKPEYTKQQWMARIYDVNTKFVSHHIKEYYVDTDVFKNADGRPMVTLFMRIKPTGPYGDHVAASLENPDENTAFSIRSITEDFVDPRTRIRVKNMLEVITHDYVIEPGIDKATKYNNPSLENLANTGNFSFSESDIIATIDYVKEIGGSMESSDRIVTSLEGMLDTVANRPTASTQIITANPFKPLSSQW